MGYAVVGGQNGGRVVPFVYDFMIGHGLCDSFKLPSHLKRKLQQVSIQLDI